MRSAGCPLWTVRNGRWTGVTRVLSEEEKVSGIEPVCVPGRRGHRRRERDGAAIALRLAEGATVVVAGRDEQKLSRTAERAAGSGEIVARVVDVRDETAVAELVDGTAEAFGRLDVLVNWAGATDFALFATWTRGRGTTSSR